MVYSYVEKHAQLRPVSESESSCGCSPRHPNWIFGRGFRGGARRYARDARRPIVKRVSRETAVTDLTIAELPLGAVSSIILFPGNKVVRGKTNHGPQQCYFVRNFRSAQEASTALLWNLQKNRQSRGGYPCRCGNSWKKKIRVRTNMCAKFIVRQYDW